MLPLVLGDELFPTSDRCRGTRQGLKGPKVKRNEGLIRQDKTAPKSLKRDFTAATINTRSPILASRDSSPVRR